MNIDADDAKAAYKLRDRTVKTKVRPAKLEVARLLFSFDCYSLINEQ